MYYIPEMEATILYSGSLLGALYDIRNLRYDGFRVLTNKPSRGAMRGHGTVNMRFAFESQLDMLAAELGLDPAAIYRRYEVFRVLTNNPSRGAMRGHGTVNMRFAFESQLDMLAAELGLDPAE